MAAAGSVIKQRRHDADGEEWTFTWQADASGDVTEGGTTGKGVFSANGYLYSMIFSPGAAAADSYDVKLLDEDGIDVLRNQGAGQVNAAGLTYDNKYRSNFLDVDGKFMYFHNQKLTFVIDDGGNLGAGTVKIKFVRSVMDEV